MEVVLRYTFTSIAYGASLDDVFEKTKQFDPDITIEDLKKHLLFSLIKPSNCDYIKFISKLSNVDFSGRG